jgi:hypothetical protein
MYSIKLMKKNFHSKILKKNTILSKTIIANLNFIFNQKIIKFYFIE